MEGFDLSGVLGALVAKYPMLVILFMVMGFLRTIFKPVTELFIAIKKHRNPEYDHAAMNKSFALKSISFILDLFASVKLPAKKK